MARTKVPVRRDPDDFPPSRRQRNSQNPLPSEPTPEPSADEGETSLISEPSNPPLATVNTTTETPIANPPPVRPFLHIIIPASTLTTTTKIPVASPSHPTIESTLTHSAQEEEVSTPVDSPVTPQVYNFSDYDFLEGQLTSVSDEEVDIMTNVGGIPLYLTSEHILDWTLVPFVSNSGNHSSPMEFDDTTSILSAMGFFDTLNPNEEEEVDQAQKMDSSEHVMDAIPDLNVAFEQSCGEESMGIGQTSGSKSNEKKRKRVGGESVARKRRKPSFRGIRLHAATFLQHVRKSKQPKKTRKQAKPDFVNRPKREQFGGLSGQQAVEWFSKMKDKIGVIDKGFPSQSRNEYPFIKTVIEAHHIDKLCEVPSSYNLTLLREFYSEVAASNAQLIHIRGKRFFLTAKAINKFLGLTPPSNT
ncbi:hypothetical protein L6452_37843 [Arctium lappa]|uniref:Uncharacterized protein n=1 Tax=Arctium lappa TaxID=4217 RepID=A0ACB8Y4U4_ARCLA|nr:hypothetical protein L6452_37843 [Arctium lappa]